MSLKSKIGAVFLAVGMITGVAVAISSPSFAASGDHFYQGGYDVNAYNGGPNVASIDINSNTDDFTAVANGSYWNLVYTGGGAYNGYCIGDFGNSSGSDVAELDTCSAGGTGSGTPWGANFTPQWSGGLVAFYDTHWLNYLGGKNGMEMTLSHGYVAYHEAAA